MEHFACCDAQSHANSFQVHFKDLAAGTNSYNLDNYGRFNQEINLLILQIELRQREKAS